MTNRRGIAAAIAAVVLIYVGIVASRAHFTAPAPTPIVYDRTGTFLAQYGDAAIAPNGHPLIEYGFWPVDPAPPRVVRATLALEDHRFWSHPGVDPRAVLRAAWRDLAGEGRRSGASTIAMQVARMQHPAPRTLWAKAIEAGTALALTARYGRAAVLAQYLRLVPYGNGSHGIGHAARWYFDKPATDLSWAEIALLCAVPRAPAAYNPLRPTGRQRAAARAGRILDALREQAVITPAEYQAAISQLASLRPGPALQRPPDALHPILRLRDLLAANPPAVSPSDNRITTTLDLATQHVVAVAMRDRLAAWRGAGAQQAAAIVLQRGTNDVLAAVGSGIYGGITGGSIDFTQASRSPGSTLKPFLYAAALQRGLLNPAEMLDDVAGRGAGIANADGRFLGRLPPRQALANSRNVPAVDVLRRLGLAAGLDLFRDLGLTAGTAAPDSLGLSMAIGALPARLDQLAAAYAALADDGVLHELRWYRGARGGPPRRVFTTAAARQVGLFLSDPLARLPGFARYGSTEYPFPVAVKTGTSQGYRDAWTVAWSSRFVVAVWVGRSDAGPMTSLGGASSAAELTRIILLQLHQTVPGDLADHLLPIPDSYAAAPVCAGPTQTENGTCGRTLQEFLPPKPPQTAAPADPEPVRLSIVTPEAGSRVWRNPESPPSAAMLALRASARPHVPQIVWYVDNQPFALSDPDVPVAWPMHAGEHHFQIGLPLRPDRSRPIRVVVE